MKLLNNRLPTLRFVLIMALIFSMSFAGCRKRSAQPFLSDLKMSDPRSGRQLLAGFYGLEDGKWRWVSHRFAVILQPPSGSEQAGATLRVQLYIPDDQIKTIGPLTLTAEIGNNFLTPETFKEAGLVEYRRDISPRLIGSHLLSAVFIFDNALPPSSSDSRELGAVVTEIALEHRSAALGESRDATAGNTSKQ